MVVVKLIEVFHRVKVHYNLQDFSLKCMLVSFFSRSRARNKRDIYHFRSFYALL